MTRLENPGVDVRVLDLDIRLGRDADPRRAARLGMENSFEPHPELVVEGIGATLIVGDLLLPFAGYDVVQLDVVVDDRGAHQSSFSFFASLRRVAGLRFFGLAHSPLEIARRCSLSVSLPLDGSHHDRSFSIPLSSHTVC